MKVKEGKVLVKGKVRDWLRLGMWIWIWIWVVVGIGLGLGIVVG